jgi:hypothetical protein
MDLLACPRCPLRQGGGLRCCDRCGLAVSVVVLVNALAAVQPGGSLDYVDTRT